MEYQLLSALTYMNLCKHVSVLITSQDFHWGQQGRAAYHMASVTEVDDSAVWFEHFSEL